MKIMTDSPIRFPGLFGDWTITLSSKAINIGNGIYWYGILIALGFLLVAGRNLPAADYGTIAYWEVPVALFVGLVVFGEALTVNTIIGGIMIIAGGAIPSVKGMVAERKQKQQDEIAENLSARIAEQEDIEGL